MDFREATKDVFDEMKKTLSPRRFKHSLSVGHWAAELARIHGFDEEKARLAGLVHDCAKEWSPKKLAAYVSRNRIAVPAKGFILKHSPNVLHAYAGAHYIAKKNWTKDREIKSAVSSHTLGRLGMSDFEKILYIADFSSPDRTYRSAGKIRAAARKDLRKAFHACLQTKIYYQLILNRPLHPLTVRIWNEENNP